MRNELLRLKKIYGLPEVITEKEQEMIDNGVPVQKILGFINFDDLQINLTYNVLIPRYETQEVVNKAMEFVNPNMEVLDLCAGSGYIGLSIKSKQPMINLTLSDISEDAILQIRENADFNGMDVKIIKSDLFKEVKGKFDLIICNPPYIPDKTKLDDSVLNFEPHIALFGGKDGNDFYIEILKNISKHLNENGVVVFEISPENVAFIETQGFTILKDINDKERIAFKQFGEGK